METGVVPEDGKKADISPIYQIVVKKDPGIYRSISLIWAPGKVMKWITKSQNCYGWKEPLKIIQSNPLPEQGQIEQVTQECVQVNFE